MKNIGSKIIFIFSFLLVQVFCNAQKEKARPNVLIIHTDEWRAQAMGYAGDQNVRTPNLDKLAATSANFVNAVSGLPVCTPHRASLITGQRPLTNGVFMNDVLLDTNLVTIAKVYRQNGYETGYIGKWHLDGLYRLSYTPPGARRQGFDYWKAVDCDHNYNHSVYYDNADSTRRYWEGYDVFAEAKDAEQYIQSAARKSQPFFLMLAIGAPHDPYHTAPEKYKQLYDPAKLSLRPNVPDSMEKQVRKDLAGYYAHMTAIDDKVGELIQTLKQEGIFDNTIILFTSDHGDLLGSQGGYFKQQPYDESIRVPMLLHYSAKDGIKVGKYNAMINSEDIMPTLLGLSGISVPASVEGVDFSKYIRGKSKDPKDSFSLITCIQPFGQWSRPNGGKEYRGIRTPRYTYVKDLKGPWLLFDNLDDPYQMHNLVNNQAYTALQNRLDHLLMEKLKLTKDTFQPGAFYLKQFHYPPLNRSETLPYYNR